MTDNNYLEQLCAFSLTRLEALIYTELLTHGKMTGYEISKETGISRSNVYASLNGLVEKGGAYLVEEESTKYIPVSVQKFTQNALRSLGKKADYLIKNAPAKIIPKEGYITITGVENIKNKIRQMILDTQYRLYFLASASLIQEFESELKALIAQKKKVVLITGDYRLKGAKVYEEKTQKGQIRFISDSSYVLTGEILGTEHDTCLYSGQENLVSVMKEALKNKITLLGGK
jgi:sugar-specific transcriptional regulator TrmB